MGKKQLEYLKQHHEFEAWCGCNTLKENLFIWNYFLSGSEFPGWQIHSNQPMTVPGWPRFIQSTWRHHEGDIETVLRVDVYECASRVKAHEFLLQLLGQFHLPNVELQEKIAVGDVAFSSPGDAVILFARANYVLLVSNAGRELVAANEVARPFDTELYSKPKKVEGVKVVPEIGRFRASGTEVRVGEGVLLELEVSDMRDSKTSERQERGIPAHLERPLCYKFFSRSGDVFLKEGRPFYKPGSAGAQEVKVFAINADRGTASKTCKFNAK